jgi:hypothetical protein
MMHFSAFRCPRLGMIHVCLASELRSKKSDSFGVFVSFKAKFKPKQRPLVLVQRHNDHDIMLLSRERRASEVTGDLERFWRVPGHFNFAFFGAAWCVGSGGQVLLIRAPQSVAAPRRQWCKRAARGGDRPTRPSRCCRAQNRSRCAWCARAERAPVGGGPTAPPPTARQGRHALHWRGRCTRPSPTGRAASGARSFRAR